MARKIEKHQHPRVESKKGHVRSNKSWPNLPVPLLGLIQNNPAVMQNMSFGGVGKFFRTTPSRCNSSHSSPPQLQLSEINIEGNSNSSGELIDSFNLTFRLLDEYQFWHDRKFGDGRYWKYIVGYSQDILLTRGSDSSEIMLVEPVQSLYLGIKLPPWDIKVPFKLVVLSSTLRSDWRIRKDCVFMVVTGTTRPALAFYDSRQILQNDSKPGWVMKDFTLPDPNQADTSKHHSYMQFDNAISMNGKFYALSLQGTLVVIEYTNSNPRIAALCRNRAVPTVPSRHFREYLVDFGGGILLLVLLISRRSGVGFVDDVEVFRFDEGGSLSWVKMDDLGDRALFVGHNCAISVPVAELGCRRNCVYFNVTDDDVWSVYDVGRGTVSSSDFSD